MSRAGLVPGQDEYKSRRPHDADRRYRVLRDELHGIVSGCSIALLVAPLAERKHLARHALEALKYFVHENAIAERLKVSFDEGLFSSREGAATMASEIRLPPQVDLAVECDSRLVQGIQLADLVAHTCGIMLLAQMGVVTKTVKAGPNSGYDEDLDLPLDFELWAGIRYQLLNRPLRDPELREAAQAGLVDTTCAVYVAPTCSTELAECARRRFARTWLGCIH